MNLSSLSPRFVRFRRGTTRTVLAIATSTLLAGLVACSSSTSSSGGSAGSGDSCGVTGTWKSSKTTYAYPDGATQTPFCTNLLTSLNGHAAESVDTFDVSDTTVTIKDSKGSALATGTLDPKSCQVTANNTQTTTTKDASGATVELHFTADAVYTFGGSGTNTTYVLAGTLAVESAPQDPAYACSFSALESGTKQ